jgi:hypothetical protein
MLTAFLSGVLLTLVLVLVIGTTNSKTRALFIKPPEPKLLTDGTSVEEWKPIFREIVTETDGGLTKEMKDFLMSGDEKASQILATALEEVKVMKARAIAEGEAEKKRLIAEAEEVRERILADGKKYKRPLLEGKYLEEFYVDYYAAKSSGERGDVVKRWHEKGFRFSLDMRKIRFASSQNEEYRNILRNMFDEQDELVEPEKTKENP